MNDQPLLGIITICKNNLTGLTKTYRSLIIQNRHNFAWFIIDGGSKDGTIEFLKGLITPFQLSFSSEEDGGLYEAMNKGILACQSDYILFLNAGDCLASEFIISDISKILVNSQPDFLYGDSYETSFHEPGRLRLKRAYSHQNIERGMFTHHQAMIFKSDIVALGGPYCTGFKIASDYDFLIRYLEQAKKICYLEQPICIFEPGGLSQKQARQARREQMQIRKNRLKISFCQNYFIYLMQAVCFFLKTKANPIYRLLRYKSISKNYKRYVMFL